MHDIYPQIKNYDTRNSCKKMVIYHSNNNTIELSNNKPKLYLRALK